MANRLARFGLASAMLAFGTVAGASAQPPAPEAAAPPADARWVVDESGALCAMARPIADGPLTLVVTSYPGTGKYDLQLVAPSWQSRIRRDSRRAVISLLPGSTVYERPVVVVNLPGSRGEALTFGLPADFLARFGEASAIRLTVEHREIGTYPVPQMAAVSRVFSDCEANKLIEWGADPAGFEPGSIRPQPIGNRDDWVGPGILRNSTDAGQTHTLGVHRLNLDIEGRPEQCTMVGGNMSPAASTRVCAALMQNARYRPARDRNGNPVRSVATYRIDLRRVRTFNTAG